MKKLFLLTIILFVNQIIFSQLTDNESKLRIQTSDTLTGWKQGGLFNAGLSQTSLTNWAAGGQSSLAINGLLSLYSNYKKGDATWDNSLDLGYGILQQGKNSRSTKTDDKIDLLSKFGMKASRNWYYAFLFNFKTQMTPGYNYPNDSTKVKISDFLAPAYFLTAIGMDYKPKNNISVFIAPLTGKITLVNDQDLANQGAFGVEKAVYDTTGQIIKKGKKILLEFGGYMRMQYKKEIMKNVLLKTELDLFSDYLKNPQNIVVNWENLISLKVNKYISAVITTNLIYDDKIKIGIDTNNDGIPDKAGPRIQFKEILSVGFAYKF
jgi:hypothetical protein